MDRQSPSAIHLQSQTCPIGEIKYLGHKHFLVKLWIVFLPLAMDLILTALNGKQHNQD